MMAMMMVGGTVGAVGGGGEVMGEVRVFSILIEFVGVSFECIESWRESKIIIVRVGII